MLRSLFRRPLVVLPALVLLLMLLALVWWVFPLRPRVGWQLPSNIGSVLVSEDGTVMAVAAGREVSLWDVESGKLKGRKALQTNPEAIGVSLQCLSKDGSTVVFQEYNIPWATGSSLITVIPYHAKLWNPTSGSDPVPLSLAHVTAYSPAQDLFTTSDGKLWEMQTGKERPLPDEMKGFSWPRVVKDGRILGLVTDGDLVSVWDLTAP